MHDLQGLIKRKKFINSAFSAIGSRIPFASGAKAIADRAVSRGTEVPTFNLPCLCLTVVLHCGCDHYAVTVMKNNFALQQS